MQLANEDLDYEEIAASIAAKHEEVASFDLQVSTLNADSNQRFAMEKNLLRPAS